MNRTVFIASLNGQPPGKTSGRLCLPLAPPQRPAPERLDVGLDERLDQRRQDKPAVVR